LSKKARSLQPKEESIGVMTKERLRQYVYLIKEIEAQEELIIKNIKKAQQEAAAIERAIQTLDNPIDRELMRLKYLDGLTWEEVAEKLCRSRQWVTVLHGRILQKLKNTCL